MAERSMMAEHRLTSIQASIGRVQDLVAGATTLALYRNQCAYLSEAQQLTARFLQREDVRTRTYDAITNISSESRVSDALIQLDSVVKRAENLVQQCCRSDAWMKGALTLFAVKYDVLDIFVHLRWWTSVLSMVIGAPTSKLSAPERVQHLNHLFEQRLLSFGDLQKAAEDDRRQLLNKVKVEIQAANGESSDTSHLLLLQVHALLTDQDEHSIPQLNEFTYDGLLGQGSFGVVHKVKWCGYDCVLKQYENWKTDDVEVKSLKSLHHPHIVRFLRHWKSENTQKYNSHILMERMERDLLDHINSEQRRTGRVRPFSLPVAIHIMLQVMSAVWHMHHRLIVHRDLKPKNVLVRESALLPEGYLEVKLGDFGIAKADMMTSNAGALTYKAGTTLYRAPELSSREYTQGVRNFPRRIDMWSFGIMCSQILTGLPPFWGIEGSNALHNHIENGGRPLLPDDCPGYLRYCIESCWHHKPENRPRASDMWRMLRIAQLRILGLVDHSCDILFHFTDHRSRQASQIPLPGPVPGEGLQSRGNSTEQASQIPPPVRRVRGEGSPSRGNVSTNQASQIPPLAGPVQEDGSRSTSRDQGEGSRGYHSASEHISSQIPVTAVGPVQEEEPQTVYYEPGGDENHLGGYNPHQSSSSNFRAPFKVYYQRRYLVSGKRQVASGKR